MKPLLFVFFVACTLVTYAQKIEKFYDYRWKETTPEQARFLSITEKIDSGWRRSDYFIQERKLQMTGVYEDSLCKKGNGQFYYYHPNGKLQRTGRFVLGKREGLWLSYHHDGAMSDSTHYNAGHKIGNCYGWYENGFASDSSVWNPDGSGVAVGWFMNGMPSYAGRYSAGGKMDGKWVYYHLNGKVSSTELYQFGKLVDKMYYDEAGNAVDTTNKDHAASFPGGTAAWQKYLLKKLYFPTQYKLVNGDRAIVIVDAVIDEEGNVTNVAVSTPFHPAFDKIAVDMVRKSPKWLPAVQHNRKLRHTIRQGVYFAQESN